MQHQHRLHVVSQLLHGLPILWLDLLDRHDVLSKLEGSERRTVLYGFGLLERLLLVLKFFRHLCLLLTELS